MTVKSITEIETRNFSKFEKLWSWLRDVDDAFNYDPQEQLYHSHEQLAREVADLQDKVRNLERREKQEK